MNVKLLEERIKKDGKILGGNVLKVNSFLNHQIDVELLDEMGKEFYRLFENENVTKILTIEASGIAMACAAARYFKVPFVFAKKSKSSNISDDVYTATVESFTHNTTNTIMVDKEFISPSDRVLIIDDFLARGQALLGLTEIVKSAGAVVVGAGIAVEKAFQDGGALVRNTGVRVESLARIESMSENGTITFC